MALIYTTATLAAATTNCLPVITFFLAVLLGYPDLFIIIITFITFYFIHFEKIGLGTKEEGKNNPITELTW